MKNPIGSIKASFRQLAFKLQKSENNYKEEPHFQEVDIFFNFVFELGKYLNPTEAARKLLEKNFSLAMANYVTGEIEIASHFKNLLRQRDQAFQIPHLHLAIQRNGLRGLIKWLIYHPKKSLQILPLLLKQSPNRPNKTKLKSVDEVSQETIKMIDDSVANFQLFAKLHQYTEEQLFSPFYLKEVPFVRIELQSFSATINDENIGVDVWLLIHRTGVAILTFGVRFSNPKSVNDIINLQVIENIEISQSEVVKSLIEFQASRFGLSHSKLKTLPTETRISGGIEWYKYNHKKRVSLLTIFHLYQDAITSTILDKQPRNPGEPSSWTRSPHWFSYPIIFLRTITPSCSSDTIFKEKYSQVLAGMIQGLTEWNALKTKIVKEIVEADFSLTDERSMYISSNNTTVIYYDSYKKKFIKKFGKNIPGQQWLYTHFQTSSIIEMLLIQTWILHVLDDEISTLSQNVTKLNEIKQELIVGLDEYNREIFSYGTAQDILKKGYKIMGVNDSYERVMFKLESIEKLIETVTSRKQERRNFTLNFVIMLLTVVAGLPSANQIVNILVSWRVLSFNSIFATIILYIVLVGIILAILIWNLWPYNRRKKIVSFDQSGPAKRPKLIWPKPVVIQPLQKKTGKANHDS